MSYANRYTRAQAETAAPERLMVLLFEAALKHMRTAAVALEQGRPADAHRSLARANEIVVQLHASLDPAHAPALCERLGELYRFVCGRLLEATTANDPRLAREAERVFAPIAEGFTQAVASLGGARP